MSTRGSTYGIPKGDLSFTQNLLKRLARDFLSKIISKVYSRGYLRIIRGYLRNI
jgi:cytoskeletal protein RodZ